MTVALRVAAALTVLAGCFALSGVSARADSRLAVSVPGLKLSVGPIVDVGSTATFSLTARSWPGPARASLRFVSPHHGFTGSMLWNVSCRCFRLTLILDKRVHPLEAARASAVVRFTSATAGASAIFSIRGLTADRKRYSPGGAPILASWIGDPRPTRNQLQHFCAWVHAADAFGLQNVAVRFVVRYQPQSQQFTVRTNANGVACSRRSIGSAAIGLRVPVDVFAGKLHASTAFTPRA